MKTVVLCLYILCPSDTKLCTGTSTRVLCRSYYPWMVMQALAVCAARRSKMNSQASRRCGFAMSPLSTGSSAKLFGFLGIHDTTGTVCFESSFDITEAGSRRVGKDGLYQRRLGCSSVLSPNYYCTPECTSENMVSNFSMRETASCPACLPPPRRDKRGRKGRERRRRRSVPRPTTNEPPNKQTNKQTGDKPKRPERQLSNRGPICRCARSEI